MNVDTTLIEQHMLEQDDDGDTLLHLLVIDGQYDLVRALLSCAQRGSVLSYVLTKRNSLHQTPIFIATAAGDLKMVRLLTSSAMRFNHLGYADMKRTLMLGNYRLLTPLHVACKQRRTDIIEHFFSLGVCLCESEEASVTYSADGALPIHLLLPTREEYSTFKKKLVVHEVIRHVCVRCPHSLTRGDGVSGRTFIHMCVNSGYWDTLCIVGEYIDLDRFHASKLKDFAGHFWERTGKRLVLEEEDDEQEHIRADLVAAFNDFTISGVPVT